VSEHSSDRRFMRRALALALRSRGMTAPNPAVGAVVVRHGVIVGEGSTQPYGGAHAEVEALNMAGSAAFGATVYVTLEPCASFGKTPPCVDTLIAAGVHRVVYATDDPNPSQRGGATKLRDAGIAIDSGLFSLDARDQNPAFFHQFASDRPFVTLKLARSLDGAIADGPLRSGWLTGAASRREVHRQRADHDAIAVGRGTVAIDDPELTVRAVPKRHLAPTRVVFARAGDVSLTSKLVKSARDVPVTVVADAIPPQRRSGLERAGVAIIEAIGLDAQLRHLRSAGLTSFYVEGGAALGDAFLQAGFVDRLVIFTAPVLLGADALRPLQAGSPVRLELASRFRLVSHRKLGDDLMAIYDLTDNVHRTR
jgi:diaminohydroxyphosphoribosylaminopyrimidine deaminase / 5-amino-6-(5-phosphoribosylamino)uracil reductase